MSLAQQKASDGAAQRTLVVRHARVLITKTQSFFAHGQDAMFKSMQAHCFELSDLRPHTTQAQNLRTAALLLERQAGAYGLSLRAALSEVIEDEFDAVIPGLLRLLRQADPATDSSLPRSLALLDVDEIERHLLIDRTAHRFNARYEPGLVTLTQAVGALLHREDFALVDCPFRPSALIRAFSIAWHMCEFDPKAVEDFLSTLDPQHSIDLAPLYTSLTELLVRDGFSAQVVHRIKRAAGAEPPAMPSRPGGAAHKVVAGVQDTAAPLSGAPPLESPAVDATGGGIVERARQFLQKLGLGTPPASSASAAPGSPGGSAAGSGGGGAHGGDGAMASMSAYPAPDPGLLGFLGRMQASLMQLTVAPSIEGQDGGAHNVLRTMRERDEVRGATEMDLGTIDALAQVFDYVFADPALPMQLKYVIGRLQIPVLKAALLDREFFLSPAHPARRLVDALAAASLGWSPEHGEDDPLFVQVNAVVNRVLTEFVDDLGLFATLLADFEAAMQQAQRQAEQRMASTASAEQGMEALQAARAHADNVVHQCIEALAPHESVPPFMLPFLTIQWREVMGQAWAHREQDGSAWEQALQTLDEVIWSTQVKTHAEERSRLMALLPDMVRRLNTSLDAIEWAGDARAAFTRCLIDTHMKVIRSPRSAPAPLETGPGELESASARRALQELEARRALQAKRRADAFDTMVQAFVRGLWFDFSQHDDRWQRYRLGWVSPRRTRLLFTNRDGFEAFVRSEQEVAELLRAGRLRVLDAQPVVERAIGHIVACADQPVMEMELV